MAGSWLCNATLCLLNFLLDSSANSRDHPVLTVCWLKSGNYLLAVSAAQHWPLIWNGAHLGALVQDPSSRSTALCCHGKAAIRSRSLSGANGPSHTELGSNSRDGGGNVNEPQAAISPMKVWRAANGCPISFWNNFSKPWFFFSFGIKKYNSYKPKIAIKILWEHLLGFICGHHAGPRHKDPSLLGTSTEEFKKLNWSRGFCFLLLNSFKVIL